MAPIPRIPFHFHAEGHAFSGEIHHPFWYPIKAKASTSLPTIGGHAAAHHAEFSFRNLVSFKNAHTHVSGRRVRDEYLTHASTIIEGLNVEGVLTADRITCNLSSTHSREHPEPLILAHGSKFENLRIKGQPVNITLRDELLQDCDTLEKLRNHVARERQSGKIRRYDDGAVICTLVEKIESPFPINLKDDHIFHVDGFGTITVAEVFAVYGSRTVTMLHLELGSPQTANFIVAEDGTNGRPWPPPP